jgi:TolB-like protein/tetratricopeptide (TPR) repeat protein
MDFGLAKLADRTKLTKTGTTLGTAAYMSPEQTSGKKVDHRSDIWSFGVILFEMITGQLPFKGHYDQAVVYSIVNEEPEPMTGLRTGVPMELERIVNKALAKNRDERYQNVADMLVDLRGITKGIETRKTEGKIPEAKRPRIKYMYLFVTLIIILILTVLGKRLFFRGSTETIDSIAVLPLVSLSNDPDQEYFVDGMTDALISELAQISALRVISRTSVMKFKETEKLLPEVAHELNVDALVEGTVLSSGNQIRITVQLIQASPEQHLWASDYVRDLKDIIQLQEEVARNIASEINVTVTQEEEVRLTSARQVNPEAYEAYIKGRSHWYKLTSQDLELALQYFELALEKDPDYALAYAGIAEVWIGFRIQGLAPSSEAWPKVKEAALKALELDDTLAEVQFMLAIVDLGEWDWRDSEKAFQRALELNPNYPDARAYYSQLLFMMRRPEEAMVQIEQAMELDPFNTLFRAIYAWDLIYAHRYDDAIDHLRETLRTAPDDWTALSTLRSVYHQKGMYEEALEIWKRSYDARNDQESEDALVRGYEEGGYSGALSSVAELLIERSRTTFVTPWQIGTLYTRAGKKDKALEWLEKAFEARDGNLIYLSVDPIFDYLRDEPRFQDMIRKMNLPIEE